ncbi:hypothetical protein BHM03_00033753, partial [Ensete ventricosum]
SDGCTIATQVFGRLTCTGWAVELLVPRNLAPAPTILSIGWAESRDPPPDSSLYVERDQLEGKNDYPLLEPNLVPAQWIRSAPVAAERARWFRPLCTSSPVVVSGRSRCTTRWMDPSYLVTGVGCWSGGARVRRRLHRSGRAPVPARRSGRVSSRRDPSDD